jgi:hypothetical protein
VHYDTREEWRRCETNEAYSQTHKTTLHIPLRHWSRKAQNAMHKETKQRQTNVKSTVRMVLTVVRASSATVGTTWGVVAVSLAVGSGRHGGGGRRTDDAIQIGSNSK